MTVYTCAFAFSGEHVLLLRKDTPSWQKGKLNGIGGKVEQGESIHTATVREFQEETGLIGLGENAQVFHSMIWPAYEDHRGWPLVYFSAFELNKGAMLEAVQNTISAAEPCVIVKADKIIAGMHDAMPNLGFLVLMAKHLVLCPPAERKLRQPIVLVPGIYDYLIKAGIMESEA